MRFARARARFSALPRLRFLSATACLAVAAVALRLVILVWRSVLSVVTWSQQEDPRWFGGSIPQKTTAVEFVKVTGPGAYSYERYEGSPLKKVANGEGADPRERAAYLLAQRAAVMP